MNSPGVTNSLNCCGNFVSMEVVVGTYEELILAYRLVSSEKGYEFELSFTDHSHTGCLRAVAISKRGILASGSSDEVIRLFNIEKHYEIGCLMHHTGFITSLSFHGKTHMFSTSADGAIGIWQVGKWECLRTLRGHKGAVHSISIHPSGKMALSVGQDKALCIWNLLTGKCAYVTHIKQAADQILWSPDGSSYLVIVNNKVDFYDVNTARVTHTIQMTGRINAAKFMKEDALVLGGEEGKLLIYDINSKKTLLEHSTNTTRVKGLCLCQDPDDTECTLLVTASSDGFLKVWRLKQSQDDLYCITALGEIQTKFRLTCAAIYCKTEDVQHSKKLTTEAETTRNLKRNCEQEFEEGEDNSCSLDLTTLPKVAKSKSQKGGKKQKKRKMVEISVSTVNKKVTKQMEETTTKLKKKHKVKRLKQK